MASSEWGKSYYWDWEGISCFWRVLGDETQKPLVLIHGFGASSSHWRNNAAYFASKNYCVYAFDLIGFGRSEQPEHKKIKSLDNVFWAKQLTSFLEDIVDTKKHGKAIIIANSLGSLISITTAAKRPDLIEKIIAAPLPDPAFMTKLNIEIPKIYKKFLVNIFFKLLPIEILIYIIVKTKLIILALQFAYYKSILEDKELHSIVTKPAQRANAAKALRSMCIGMSLRPKAFTAPKLLQKIEKFPEPIPILLVWGRQDNLIPLMLGKKIIEQFKQLNLLVLEDNGHCPHDESPEIFNKFVWEWIERNSTILKEKK